MSNHSPIPSPPPELVEQWEQQFLERPTMNGCFVQSYIATKAAQWGADQELEACVKWIEDCGYHPSVPEDLRAARRRPPLSLKEQALEAQRRMWSGASNHDDWDLVRRALEQLPD